MPTKRKRLPLPATKRPMRLKKRKRRKPAAVVRLERTVLELRGDLAYEREKNARLKQALHGVGQRLRELRETLQKKDAAS